MFNVVVTVCMYIVSHLMLLFVSDIFEEPACSVDRSHSERNDIVEDSIVHDPIH